MKKPNKYPKFLKCNDIVKSWCWNKYLLMPWKSGELVRVAPETEQHAYSSVSISDEEFRKRYVVVYRIGSNGKFTIKSTANWLQFDSLTINKSNENY